MCALRASSVAVQDEEGWWDTSPGVAAALYARTGVTPETSAHLGRFSYAQGLWRTWRNVLVLSLTGGLINVAKTNAIIGLRGNEVRSSHSYFCRTEERILPSFCGTVSRLELELTSAASSSSSQNADCPLTGFDPAAIEESVPLALQALHGMRAQPAAAVSHGTGAGGGGCGHARDEDTGAPIPVVRIWVRPSLIATTLDARMLTVLALAVYLTALRRLRH